MSAKKLELVKPEPWLINEVNFPDIKVGHGVAFYVREYSLPINPKGPEYEGIEDVPMEEMDKVDEVQMRVIGWVKEISGDGRVLVDLTSAGFEVGECWVGEKHIAWHVSFQSMLNKYKGGAKN